jgi:lipopolysaccharide biosynthesis protein
VELLAELWKRLRRKGVRPLFAAVDAVRDRLRIAAAQRRARVVLRQRTWRKFDPADLSRRPVCVFSHFDAAQRISPAVVHYLAGLREVSSHLIFVSTSERLPESELDHLDGLADQAIVRANIGYDFGSWHTGLRQFDYAAAPGLILANDSVIGPFHSLADVMGGMQPRGFDMWGMVDSYERAYHLQSYFLRIAPVMLRAGWFRRFWESMVYIPNAFKYLIISCYEIGLSQRALFAGHKIGPVCRTRELHARLSAARQLPPLPSLNVSLECWEELLRDDGVPFVKKSLFANSADAARRLPRLRAALAGTSFDIERFIPHPAQTGPA